MTGRGNMSMAEVMAENKREIITDSNRVGTRLKGISGKKVVLVVDRELLTQTRYKILEKLLPLQTVCEKIEATMDVVTEANDGRFAAESKIMIDMIEIPEHYKTTEMGRLKLGVGEPTKGNVEMFQYIPLSRLVALQEADGDSKTAAFVVTKDVNKVLRAIRANLRYLFLQEPNDTSGKGSLITLDATNLDTEYAVNTFLKMIESSVSEK